MCLSPLPRRELSRKRTHASSLRSSFQHRLLIQEVLFIHAIVYPPAKKSLKFALKGCSSNNMSCGDNKKQELHNLPTLKSVSAN